MLLCYVLVTDVAAAAVASRDGPLPGEQTVNMAASEALTKLLE
jgi:hypothetical protein